MAGATERRTLEIVAAVKDLATTPLQKIGRSIKGAVAQGARDFQRLAGSVFNVRTALAALTGGFAAFRGGAAVVGIAQATDELAKLARGTGSTVQRLQVLKNAFELNNQDAGRFRSILASLTKSMGTALTDSGSKSAKALGRLGLTLDDLRSKDPVALFDRLAGSLERFTTPQEKAAAILEVFPKATGEVSLLVEMLGQGQQSFRQLVAMAEFFGGTLDEKAVASVLRFNQSLDVMQLAMGKIGREATVAIAEKLAPIFERLATWFATNGKRIGEVLGTLAAAVAKMVLSVGAAILRLIAFLSSSGDKIAEGLESIPLVGGKAAEAIRALFDVRQVAPGARAIRDEMAATADALAKLEVQERQLAKVREKAAAGGAEGGGQREFANDALRNLVAEREQLMRRMTELAANFSAEQQRAGLGAVSPDAEQSRQMEGAKLRAFAGEVAQLSQFENLPEPPTDYAPIMKALFGDLGVDGGTEKVRSFTDGVSDGLERIQEKWSDFGAAGEEAITNLLDGGLEGLTDAFADIVTQQKTAKEAFRDLAKTMLGELAKIIAKLIIMKTLQAFGLPAIGAETGGVLPGEIKKTVPVRRFASGGVVRRPTLALFGEGRASKGEAFVPLPDGRRIPVALMGGGGGSPTMHITIQAMDGADVQRVLLQNRGTLRAIWQHDLTHVRGVRQTVQGVR